MERLAPLIEGLVTLAWATATFWFPLMVAIGVFFPVVINATTGVLEINKIYLDVGRNFKASRWNTFWTIALPGALPVLNHEAVD